MDVLNSALDCVIQIMNLQVDRIIFNLMYVTTSYYEKASSWPDEVETRERPVNKITRTKKKCHRRQLLGFYSGVLSTT